MKLVWTNTVDRIREILHEEDFLWSLFYRIGCGNWVLWRIRVFALSRSVFVSIFSVFVSVSVNVFVSFIELVAATAFCGFWDGSLPSQDRLLLPNQEAKRPKKAWVDQRSIQLGKKLRRDPFIRQICPIFQWQAYIGSAGLLSLYESDQHWSLNIQHEDKWRYVFNIVLFFHH